MNMFKLYSCNSTEDSLLGRLVGYCKFLGTHTQNPVIEATTLLFQLPSIVSGILNRYHLSGLNQWKANIWIGYDWMRLCFRKRDSNHTLDAMGRNPDYAGLFIFIIFAT